MYVACVCVYVCVYLMYAILLFFEEQMCLYMTEQGKLVLQSPLSTTKGQKRQKRKLQHSLRHLLDRLPDAQIRQNLFGATENGIELVCAVEHFDDAAHAALRDTTSAENVGRRVRDLVRRPRNVRLEQPNGTAQVLRLLRVAHVTHLVGYGFKPGLVGFDVGDHRCESMGG